MENRPAIPRHRTAIRRLGHSRPVSLAQAHGLIGPGLSFFDYQVDAYPFTVTSDRKGEGIANFPVKWEMDRS